MTRRAGLLLAVAAVGCAQPGVPPGGQPDQNPPLVRAVRPEAFDTLADLESPVVIEWDERISERLEGVATWTEAVLVSPATSPVKAERHGRRVEITLEDGWEPDRVYRVTVAPVYRDLFNNSRERPVYLVFSTGAPFWDGAVAGFASDRITGRPVAGARVEARRRIDGARYVAVTDTSGFFALQYMPGGAYDLVAWRDDNRDLAMDFFEIQDSVEVAFGAADTAITELALLPRDSTPARLARAEALDSLTVQLTFDDYFDAGRVWGSALVFLLPDSVPGPEGELMHPARLDSIRAAEAEAADTSGTSDRPEQDPRDQDPREQDPREQDPREQDPREQGRPQRDRPAPGPGAPPSQRRGSEPGPALPGRELILLLARPLAPDTTYAVRVDDAVNIQGVLGGGGTAEFRSPEPPPPESEDEGAPSDTVSPPDSVVSAPPDTTAGQGLLEGQEREGGGEPADSTTRPQGTAEQAGAVPASDRPETEVPEAVEWVVAGEWLYTVQAASFENEGSARQLRAELEEEGVPAWNNESIVEGRTFFRVRIGVLAERAEAQGLAERVRARFDGPVWVTEIEPSSLIPANMAAVTRAFVAGGVNVAPDTVPGRMEP